MTDGNNLTCAVNTRTRGSLDTKALAAHKGKIIVQDFICAWFPKHGKGKAKQLLPKKDPAERCKFLENRG